jgi:hypothetical protein
MASRWSSTPDCSLYDTSSATAAATRRSVTSSRCTWDVGSRSPSLMTSTRAVSGSTALLSATEGASRCRRVATVASTASTSTAPSARAARHNARPRMCNGEQSVALRTPERTTEGARKARLHLTMRRVCKMSQRVHRMRGARARGTGSGSRPRQMHARTPVGATSARTVPTDTSDGADPCELSCTTVDMHANQGQESEAPAAADNDDARAHGRRDATLPGRSDGKADKRSEGRVRNCITNESQERHAPPADRNAPPSARASMCHSRQARILLSADACGSGGNLKSSSMSTSTCAQFNVDVPLDVLLDGDVYGTSLTFTRQHKQLDGPNGAAARARARAGVHRPTADHCGGQSTLMEP